MKVLLVAVNSKYIHTNLSIRYLKSYCDDTNECISLSEFTINQNTDYIAAEIYKTKVDLVAFSSYIWNIEKILEISKILKIVNPNIKILLGGPEVSYDSEKILEKNNYIDYIISGEGEETFKEFLLYFKGNIEITDIDGLIYRNNDIVYKNKDRAPLVNLNDIPSPFNGDLSEYNNKIVYYESSRGCPFNCKFCLSSTNKGIRCFSLERVKSDLDKLIKAKVKQVKFIDRTFNADKKFALQVMKHIVEKNTTDINFHFEVTAHLMDDEILDFLKDIKEGLFQFEIGVQSTNEKTLKTISRITDFEKLSKVVKKINSYKNIHQHLDLIAALPYEDYKSFKKSFNDVYNLKPEKLQLGFLKLLKGSELRNNAEKYGFKYIDKPPYEVLQTNDITYEELLKLKSIEDILEKFGNENNFKNSVDYIIKNHYNNIPFEFYEDFSDYWENKNFHEISHSKKGLYKILFEFYYEKLNSKDNIFNEILKFDYILNNKSTKLPDYIDRIDVDKLNVQRHNFLKDINNIDNYLPNYKNKTAKNIIKDIHFEKFKFNILYFINNNFNLSLIENNEVIVLFNYKNDILAFNNASTHNVTNEFKCLEE